jgi:hypothetical protein
LRKTHADPSKIAGRNDVKLDDDETTGKNNFLYQVGPDVTGAVIDKRSETGRVAVTGHKTQVIKTGPQQTGQRFVEIEIADGDTCMIYGFSSLIYIKPRKS